MTRVSNNYVDEGTFLSHNFIVVQPFEVQLSIAGFIDKLIYEHVFSVLYSASFFTMAAFRGDSA